MNLKKLVIYLIFIFGFALSPAHAFTPVQKDIIREGLIRNNAGSFVTVIDGVINDQYAYTNLGGNQIYLDGVKFKDAPNTLANTISHEVSHTHGNNHGDGGPFMNYSITLNQFGKIINDPKIL